MRKRVHFILDLPESDEEFLETFSDIDYALHVKQAKDAAVRFKKPSKRNFILLKPIPEDETTMKHIYYKCLF